MTSVFDYSSDFSKAFAMFGRALILICVFIFVCFYLNLSELHVQVFDKLIRALIASDLVARILK